MSRIEIEYAKTFTARDVDDGPLRISCASRVSHISSTSHPIQRVFGIRTPFHRGAAGPCATLLPLLRTIDQMRFTDPKRRSSLPL